MENHIWVGHDRAESTKRIQCTSIHVSYSLAKPTVEILALEGRALGRIKRRNALLCLASKPGDDFLLLTWRLASATVTTSARTGKKGSMAASPEPTPSQQNGAGSSPPQRQATPPPGSSSSTGVQELSRLLLEGWTMLAETCPRAHCTMPLARSRSGRVVCCSCGLDVVSRAATEEGKTEEADGAREVSHAIVPAGRSQRDAMSVRLGEKLLQGWTMLEEACERCALPLLREGSGRVVCVGCEGEGGRQLMPRVVHVGANDGMGQQVARTGGAGGQQVARAGGGVGQHVARAGGAVGQQVARAAGGVERTLETGDGRGGSRGRAVGGGNRVEGRGPVRGLPPPPVRLGDGPRAVGEGEGPVDVQWELELAEIEAGRKLGVLRVALGEAEDAETCRALAMAMVELVRVVRIAREARAAAVRVKRSA